MYTRFLEHFADAMAIARLPPHVVAGRRLRSADPPALARHGCRPSPRTSTPHPARPRRRSTAVAGQIARRSTVSCSSTSRPAWHTGASVSCGAFSSAPSWPAASPAPAAVSADTISWSPSPARAAACLAAPGSRDERSRHPHHRTPPPDPRQHLPKACGLAPARQRNTPFETPIPTSPPAFSCLDCYTPLGVAHGVLYVIPVLAN